MLKLVIIFVISGVLFTTVTSIAEKDAENKNPLKKLVDETSNSFSDFINIIGSGIQSGIKITGLVLKGVTGTLNEATDKIMEILGLKTEVVKNGVGNFVNISKNVFDEIGNFTQQLGNVMKKFNESKIKMDLYEKESINGKR